MTAPAVIETRSAGPACQPAPGEEQACVPLARALPDTHSDTPGIGVSVFEAATGGVGEPTASPPAPTLSREEFRARVVYECRRRGGQDGYDVVWNGLVAGWVWRKPLHMGGKWLGLAFIYGAEDRRNTPVMDGGMATWRSRDAVAEAVVRRVGRAVVEAEVWPIPARTVEGFEQGSMRGMSAMEGEGWLRR